jgi:hypothetical protein
MKVADEQLNLKALIHAADVQKKFYQDPSDNLAYVEQLANAGWDFRKDAQDSIVFAENLATVGWDVRLDMGGTGRVLLVDGEGNL